MVHHRRLSHVFLLPVLALAVTLSLPTPSPAQGNGNLPPDLQALVEEALQANAEIKQMRVAPSRPPRRPSAPPGPWMTRRWPFTMKDIPDGYLGL